MRDNIPQCGKFNSVMHRDCSLAVFCSFILIKWWRICSEYVLASDIHHSDPPPLQSGHLSSFLTTFKYELVSLAGAADAERRLWFKNWMLNVSEWSEPRQNPCVCFPQLAKKIREKFNRYLDVVNRNKQVVEASYTAHLTSPLTAIQDCCSIPASMMEWVTPTVSYKCLSRMLMVTMVMKAPVLVPWLIPVRSSERQLLANTTSFPSLEMIWLVLISNDCVYMTSSTAVLRTPMHLCYKNYLFVCGCAFDGQVNQQ